MDDVLGVSDRASVDEHLSECQACSKLIANMREVVSLAHDKGLYPVPEDFSRNLYAKLDAHLGKSRFTETGEVPLGITPDMVPVGTHLIHFWQTQKEFEAGVRFLEPSMNKNEHCVIFGHDEALENVQECLRDFGYDPERLIREQKLTVLRRHVKASETIAEIGRAIETALNNGATMVRFLGNLGLGKAPLPGGEDDVLELEAKADALVSQLPVIIVCMYDVRTLPGKLIIQGGLQSHGHIVCPTGARENPFYSGEHDSGTDQHHLQ